MTPSDLYDENQKYQYYEMLMNSKEYLSKTEYDFCYNFDNSVKNQVMYIGDYSTKGAYLNLNLYSEHEHHDRVYRMERGI